MIKGQNHNMFQNFSQKLLFKKINNSNLIHNLIRNQNQNLIQNQAKNRKKTT